MPIQQMMLGLGGEASDITWSNLVLYLDAGNTNSYSGSGTTWSDLTDGNHHATLIHSPTYSSTSRGGSFTFDGTNDYATIPDATDFLFGTGDYTEEAWYKRTSTSGEEVVIERGNSSSWQGTRMDELIPKPKAYTESTGSIEVSQTNAITAQGYDWFYSVFTKSGNSTQYRKFYFNSTWVVTNINSSISGWQPKGTSVSSDYNLHIAGADSSKRFTGEIAIIRIYKGKALSQSEITQHYNAEKSRFGHS